MKSTMELISIGIIAGCSIMSCTKKSTQAPVTPVTTSNVLMTEIIDSNPNDGGNFGKPEMAFQYSGKQLSSAILYADSTLKSFETDVFKYNTQGQLTGTTISYTLNGTIIVPPDSLPVSSVITYNGNNISEMKFYTSSNALYDDAKLTWKNNQLTTMIDVATFSIADYYGESYAYTYNSSNNDASIVGGGYSTIFTAFDNKQNLAIALPFWEYFLIHIGPNEFCIQFPGVNNPTTDSEGETFRTYQYNNYGFPSEMTQPSTDQNGGFSSYKYNYTQVN